MATGQPGNVRAGLRAVAEQQQQQHVASAVHRGERNAVRELHSVIEWYPLRRTYLVAVADLAEIFDDGAEGGPDLVELAWRQAVDEMPPYVLDVARRHPL